MGVWGAIAPVPLPGYVTGVKCCKTMKENGTRQRKTGGMMSRRT